MAGSRSFADRASALSYARKLKKDGYMVVVYHRGNSYIVVPQ